MNTYAKKKLLLITCGGTIACVKHENGGVVPQLTAEDLLNKVPDHQSIADIETITFTQVSSTDMSLVHILGLYKLIEDQAFDGYIITQGTDSIEETAFALDLIYQGIAPVIITGAMRHFGLNSPDGSANLCASFQVADNFKSRGKGVVVVMNDTVHAARFVHKAHASRVDAFQSLGGAPIGYLSEDNYIETCQLNAISKISVEQLSVESDDLQVSVPIITSHSGDDGKTLDLMAKSGLFKGVVVDGAGGGHVSKAMAAAIAHATETMVVVVSTRATGGSTYYNTYGSIGNEIDLQKNNAIMPGELNSIQTRIFLQYQLTLGVSVIAIKQAFSQFS